MDKAGADILIADYALDRLTINSLGVGSQSQVTHALEVATRKPVERIRLQTPALLIARGRVRQCSFIGGLELPRTKVDPARASGDHPDDGNSSASYRADRGSGQCTAAL